MFVFFVFWEGGWPPCVCAYLYFRISLRSCHYAYSKNTVRVNWAATYLFLLSLLSYKYPSFAITHYSSLLKKNGHQTQSQCSISIITGVTLPLLSLLPLHVARIAPNATSVLRGSGYKVSPTISQYCWVWPLSRKHLYQPTCRLLSPTPTSHPHPTMMPVIVLLNRTFHSDSSKLWMCRFNWQANVYRTKEARGRHGQAAACRSKAQTVVID